MTSNSAPMAFPALGGGRTLQRQASLGDTVSAGLLGDLVCAGTIWVYEAMVWVGLQHLMPLAGIPWNAVGLVFGKGVQDSLGALPYPLGTAIHRAFALRWAAFRRHGMEAALLVLFCAVVAWVVIHVAIALTLSSHPDYLDPNVVIGGFLSHIFFTVPLALVVKRRLG